MEQICSKMNLVSGYNIGDIFAKRFAVVSLFELGPEWDS
jgi:hypothetical protein